MRTLPNIFAILATCLTLAALVRAADTVTIQNQTYSSGQNTQVVANVLISADTNVTVSSGATVKYVAGSRLVLGPGFSAQEGSSFRASVDTALQNPDADDDGDGVSNRVEALLGTDSGSGTSTSTDNSGIFKVLKP